MPDSPKCIACGNNHDSTVTCDSWSTFLSAIRNDPAEIPVIPGMQEITRKQFLEICGPDAELEPGWAYGTDNGGITITSRYTPPDEIPVTDEMKETGFQVAIKLQPRSPLLVETLEAVYRAMHAVAPVPLVSEAEDRIAALTKERDADKRLIECDTVAIVAQAGENIRLRALLATKDAEIALLRQALAMKDARIGELKSVLASTPVAFEDPDAKPEPEINPFRNFGHDPRRMGPL